MARVFVSHASGDRAVASEVHRWLIGAGHEVFVAQDLRDGITVGEQWERRLHERLRWADAVVCVVTSAYLTSRWCAAEVATARSRGSRLLPVRAEPAVTDPLLDSVQHTDMAQDPQTARAWLVEALRRVDAAGGLGWPDGRCAFPGLRAFDVDEHRVFFGRGGEVARLAGLLRSAAQRVEGAALVVVGPSGCGKSSLVRAGLVPVMAGEPGWWTLAPMVPGADPVAALVRELAGAARRVGLDWTVAQVCDRLDEAGLTPVADEVLLAALGGRRGRLLVVVDQFEELLTQAPPAARARFAGLVGPALGGPVQVVATLRPEFLDQLLVDPELATLPTHTVTLRPLRREALREVIEGPARLAGIGVDDELVARLVADTDTGEALPLLAFTLAQLAADVDRGGRLSAVRYEQLGGVRGALARQADAALAGAITAGGRDRDQVIAGLLGLVSVDEQGRPTRWRVPRDEQPDPLATEWDAFITRRLLITDTDHVNDSSNDKNGNGTVLVGVAHEALLSAWPPLAEAITAARSALRARRAVEHATTEWDHHKRAPGRLWERGQLAAALADTGAQINPAGHSRAAPSTGAPSSAGAPSAPGTRRPMRWWPRRPRVLVTDRVELSPNARAFLLASVRRDRRRRGRATTILSMLLILALTAAGIAVVQRQAATQQQRLAIARQLVAQAETARASDPRTALLLGTAAQRIHSDAQIRTSLVTTLANTRYAGTLTGHTGSVWSVVFSPDGNTLASAGFDGMVRLWDLTDRVHPIPLGAP
ncbi:MAG: TIR domain-containing protein, partial [Pseudonocardiaceae bacterium]